MNTASGAREFLGSLAVLKETPLEVGEPEPPANPLAIIIAQDKQSSGKDLWRTLCPLFSNPGFWMVCGLSFTFTLVRETFNLWSPTYFIQVLGLSPAEAARESALFPLFGGFSVLLAGCLSDRVKQAGRATIISGGLLAAGVVLFLLGVGSFETSRTVSIVFVTLVGFLMIGPYSYLAGAVALDLGGKLGCGTTSGIIDGVGYLGGIFAGDSIARVSIAYGWRGTFVILAVLVWLSSVVAFFYRRHSLTRVVSACVMHELDSR